MKRQPLEAGVAYASLNVEQNSEAQMVEIAKNFILVMSVTAIPIVLWYGLVEIARRSSEEEQE